MNYKFFILVLFSLLLIPFCGKAKQNSDNQVQVNKKWSEPSATEPDTTEPEPSKHQQLFDKLIKEKIIVLDSPGEPEEKHDPNKEYVPDYFEYPIKDEMSPNVQQLIQDIDKEVLSINFMELKKKRYYEHHEYQMTIDNNFYYDEQGKIRKVIINEQYDDGESYSISYYDEQGLLLYSLSESSEAGGDVSFTAKVKAYGNETGYIYKRVFISQDYSELYDSQKQLIDGSMKYLFDSSKPKNVNELYKTDLKDVKDKPFSTVYFAQPEVGDTVYLNDNRVNLRSEPSLNSKVVHKGYLLYQYKVLEIGSKETIPSLGEHYWYKIQYIVRLGGGKIKTKTAWVYGAFLEPVEKSVQ